MLNELEQKIRKAIPELYVALGHGKPIQLNHVLLYVRRLNAKEHKYSEVGLESKITDLLKLWRLDKNLLSDQNEVLIKFVNEL